MTIEELNRQLFEETVDEMEKRKENEREEKLMNENSKNEKDLELGATNPSQSDSTNNSTIGSIIQQESDNNNKEQFEFFDSVESENISKEENPRESDTDLQKAFERTELSFEIGKMYKAQVRGFDVVEVLQKDMKIFNCGLNVYLDRNTFKEESISLFFNDNRKCIDASMEKLKELTMKFNFELKKEHCVSLDSIATTLKHLVGMWVEVIPTERFDAKIKKTYTNFEVVNILGKDYDLGGNL